MNRSFKYFTIQAGGTPQPLVGSYLTAAVTAAQVAAANVNGNIMVPIALAVADSSMFKQGDYLSVVDPGTYAMERVIVTSVPAGGNQVVVTGLQNTHPGGAYGVGAWVALASLAQGIYLQGKDGNAGTLYLGTSPQMVTATGTYMMTQLKTAAAGSQPNQFATSLQGPANTEAVNEYWIDGTTGDSYLASIGVL